MGTGKGLTRWHKTRVWRESKRGDPSDAGYIVAVVRGTRRTASVSSVRVRVGVDDCSVLSAAGRSGGADDRRDRSGGGISGRLHIDLIHLARVSWAERGSSQV